MKVPESFTLSLERWPWSLSLSLSASSRSRSLSESLPRSRSLDFVLSLSLSLSRSLSLRDSLTSTLRSDLDFSVGSSFASPSATMPLDSSSDFLESFRLSNACFTNAPLLSVEAILPSPEAPFSAEVSVLAGELLCGTSYRFAVI